MLGAGAEHEGLFVTTVYGVCFWLTSDLMMMLVTFAARWNVTELILKYSVVKVHINSFTKV